MSINHGGRDSCPVTREVEQMKSLSIIRLVVVVGVIAFTWMNAEISESVSTVQLDRAYHCFEVGIACKFGNIPAIPR